MRASGERHQLPRRLQRPRRQPVSGAAQQRRIAGAALLPLEQNPKPAREAGRSSRTGCATAWEGLGGRGRLRSSAKW